jgi:hypothetical protein
MNLTSKQHKKYEEMLKPCIKGHEGEAGLYIGSDNDGTLIYICN